MDQHPLPPAEQSPEPAAPRPRGTLALCVVSALAIAAGTLGAGAYINKDSLVWQRILGTEQVPEAVRTPADELLPLLDSARLATAGKAADANQKLRAEWVATLEMLNRHVGLLTPSALPSSGDPAPQSAGPSASPSAAQSPAEAKAYAKRLASAGVALVDEALGAPAQESRSLAGAGFELTLQARNLLRAAGGTQEQIDKLPAPQPASAAAGASGSSVGPAELPRFVLSGCPVIADSTAPGPASSSSIDDTDVQVLASESGTTLGWVADAAYRLGYAYNVAGARTAGTVREGAWARSASLVGFATDLEHQFAGVGACEPLRQPAYQLPDDAVVNPLDAARSGEEQLALLLRDAAATQEGDARAFLLQRAWDQGLYTRQATGKIPGFTHVAGDATDESPSSSPAPTP
ncbi:hypothetical protein ACFY5D_18565 [Paeniglutamicibacter sp. NPDC012692]|uniref:hypothetical protein n=1 Tax=Paeniglutamicibacter sp. NPDC012692 TaxID=3364388 RepID=UPI003690DD31